MPKTANKPLNIEVSAFGEATQTPDWLNEAAWIFPLVMLTPEPAEVLRVLAARIAKISTHTFENFDLCAAALSQKSKAHGEEIERIRHGLCAVLEAPSIADHQPLRKDGEKMLREALWEALETESMGLEPVRKGLEKELQEFLKTVEQTPAERLDQAQSSLEEALLEGHLERAHLIRDARRLLKEVISVDNAPLDPIHWAQMGWINWQITSSETESLEWFNVKLQSLERRKGFGLGLCARLNAYFYAKRGMYNDAYRWSKSAADLWPCLGTFHERAQYALEAVTMDIAKREVAAFIKKSPLATIIAFSDPTFSQMGPELLEICITRQLQTRQRAQVAVGDWEFAANGIGEVLKVLPNIQIATDLIEGPSVAKRGLDCADFLVSTQTLAKATDCKASLTASIHTGIQNEVRKRTEALMNARRNAEAIMQERDALLKASTDVHEDEIASARAALVAAEDNSKAQKGCGMGMGGGCAILILYMIASFALSGKGISLGPTSPMGMVCIGFSLVPLGASVLYYVGCMSRRMVLESKLAGQIAEAQRAFEVVRTQTNSKFKDQLEAAKAKVTQEEHLLQRAEAAARQFGC